MNCIIRYRICWFVYLIQFLLVVVSMSDLVVVSHLSVERWLLAHLLLHLHLLHHSWVHGRHALRRHPLRHHSHGRLHGLRLSSTSSWGAAVRHDLVPEDINVHRVLNVVEQDVDLGLANSLLLKEVLTHVDVEADRLRLL